MGNTKMTVAQALVKFLDNQYIDVDGQEIKFVQGIITIFGHGNVVGLGQALDEDPGQLKYYQGKNEQGMAHIATAYARQNNRQKIIAVSSSIGPGAANMVTAAGTATVNNIPLLLLPGDSFATRQPDPVLQQIEQSNSLATTTNDAFKAVCKYWDRVSRPEQLMSAMVNAMRVLTDPVETGAVCVALPQDVQGESYEYPDYFFEKRVHRIARRIPTNAEIKDAVEMIQNSKNPIIICGGGVKYSDAGKALELFSTQANIPFAETQAGKSACKSSHANNLGGIGVTGNSAANTIGEDADLVIAVGSRLSDFTTSSKWLFKKEGCKVLSINLSRFHAYKLDATPIIADAKLTLEALTAELSGYKAAYTDEVAKAKAAWDAEMEGFSKYTYGKDFKPLIDNGDPESIPEFVKETGSSLTQVSAICKIRETIDNNANIIGAAGSLPGDLQRMWTTDEIDSYHMEYGYSCMGYEIAGAVGIKLAQPDKEVYAMCGDGSFYMLHTELLTSLQEHAKINILLFDNAANGCINNLEMGNGIGNLGTEFRYADKAGGQMTGPLFNTDFAKVAEAYGAKGYHVTNLQELEEALEDAKKQNVSTLIDLKVLPKTMTADYLSWWHVGTASTAKKEGVQKAHKSNTQHVSEARKY